MWLYKYYVYILLQVADPDVPPAHRTFNILYRYIRVQPAKAREKVPAWVDKHKDWVQKVTAQLLERKNRKFEDFLIYWLHGSFPLDEAGILILARAYKIHVAVFFNNHYWTTNKSSNLNECTVFLIYRGDLVFMDSRHLLTKEFDEHRPLMQKLKKYYDTPAADKPLQRHQVRAARKSINHIPSDIDESESESSLSSSSSSSSSSSTQENIMPTSPSPSPANSQQMDLEDIMNDDEGEGEAAAASSGSDSDQTEPVDNSFHEEDGEAQSEQPVQSSEKEEEDQDGEAVKKEEPMQSSEDEEPDGAPVKMEQPVQNSEEEHDQGEAANTSHEEDTSTDSESEESSYLCQMSATF